MVGTGSEVTWSVVMAAAVGRSVTSRQTYTKNLQGFLFYIYLCIKVFEWWRFFSLNSCETSSEAHIYIWHFQLSISVPLLLCLLSLQCLLKQFVLLRWPLSHWISPKRFFFSQPSQLLSSPETQSKTDLTWVRVTKE